MTQQFKKIGFVAGSWDLLHPGHLHIFHYMLDDGCDFIIVGLQTDPTIDRKWKNKPIQTTYERWYQLNALSFIDTIIPYDTENDLENIFKMFLVDVRYIGSDYEGKDFTGKQHFIDNNIKIEYVQRKHSFSTTELRERIKNADNFRTT